MKIINKPSGKSTLFPCFEKAAKLLADAGASSVSYIPTDQCRILRPYLLPEYAAGALIFTVPYLCEAALSHRERNLSLYAVPRDYHIFFKELFDCIENILNAEFPNIEVHGFSDHSPIDEVHAAALAGLGVIGDNKLLITEEYGSYVFIGELYLSEKHEASDTAKISFSADADQNLSEPEKNIRYASSKQESGNNILSEENENPTRLTQSQIAGVHPRTLSLQGKNNISALPSCIHCGACTANCPSPSLCLSSLTQKKGRLTTEGCELIRKNDCVWGCDICQTVCPMNSRTKETSVQFFRESLRYSLTLSELEQMSEAEFSERAYAWRGRKTIARNLMIKES